MMKFLTPDLYIQLQSSDPEQATAAEDAIERAGEAYNRHWELIRERLPAEVVRFHDQEMLHDADLFGPAWLAEDPALGRGGEVVLVARQVNTLHAPSLNTLAFLHYEVTAEPTVEVPIRTKQMGRSDPNWEWDEFDVVSPGVFTHAIFLGDGRVITIPFRDFRYHLARLVVPEANGKLYAMTAKVVPV